MSRAFDEVFAVPNAFNNISMLGRTDTWIVSDAVSAHGLAPDRAQLARFHDVYLGLLHEELGRAGPRKGVMPGVVPLLDLLEQRDDVYLGLLTGNYEAAAEAKLAHFDLWRYFRCGAFGDDAPDRNRLLPRAVARVRECGGPVVAPADVVVIGDTPLDVECAANSGARSIAVATGGYDVEALQTAGADVTLQDLSDIRQVLLALQITE